MVESGDSLPKLGEIKANACLTGVFANSDTYIRAISLDFSNQHRHIAPHRPNAGENRFPLTVLDDIPALAGGIGKDPKQERKSDVDYASA